MQVQLLLPTAGGRRRGGWKVVRPQHGFLGPKVPLSDERAGQIHVEGGVPDVGERRQQRAPLSCCRAGPVRPAAAFGDVVVADVASSGGGSGATNLRRHDRVVQVRDDEGDGDAGPGGKADAAAAAAPGGGQEGMVEGIVMKRLRRRAVPESGQPSMELLHRAVRCGAVRSGRRRRVLGSVRTGASVSVDVPWAQA